MVSYLPLRGIVTSLPDADVFPTISGQKLIVQKSPTFPPTIVRRSVTGREVRASFADIPYWQFKLDFESIRDRVSYQELQWIFGFFLSHIGRLGPWFYLDPFDNAVTDVVFGTGDGVTTTFQLSRTVNPGGIYAFYEPVYVLYGTPTIKKAGVSTGAYTLGTLGAITFNTAPANGAALTWTGSFMFLCRFEKDQIDPGQVSKDLWEMKGLEFTSWIPL